MTAVAFSPQFDRAAVACGRAQALLGRAAAAAARSRELRATSLQTRRHARETREAWKGAEAIHATMRGQVARVTAAMRGSGMGLNETTAAVRAHLRFVLYDGGMREVDAEPVVARVHSWVVESYLAA